MNKLVKYSAAMLLTAGLFGMSTQTANAATGYQRLTHNAYAYNVKGQRANKKLYRKGSRVRVIGSIKLNGKKYNIISGNVYIKASNFKKARANANAGLGDGYETSLIRNSYVYNSKGQRIKGMKLRKNHSITYYGEPIRIRGKKYVMIGENQYVRSCNVLLSYDGPTGSDSMNHTHHNTASSTIKRNSASNSTSNSASNTNSSSTANSSNSTANGSGNNSSSNKNTSNQSSNTSQSDNKTDTKDTNKNNTAKIDPKDKPTEADYTALMDAIALNRETDPFNSTFDVQKTYNDAYDKLENYYDSRNDPNSTVTSKDIHDALDALNTAIKNFNGREEMAKRPKVTVKMYDTGYVWEWNSDEEKQALKVIDEIWGSKNAHITNVTQDGVRQVVLTDGDGNIRTLGLNYYGIPVYVKP